MGAFSRTKGAVGERQLVIYLRERGFLEVRRGLCQEEKKGFRPDVLGEWEGKEYSFEHKSYKAQFKWLYDYTNSQGVQSLGVLRLVLSPNEYVAIGFDPVEVLTSGFDRPFLTPTNTDARVLKRITALKKLKKEADFLVLKDNSRKRLFLKYWEPA